MTHRNDESTHEKTANPPETAHAEYSDLTSGTSPQPGKNPSWTGLSASVPGRKHIREGIPCQDASATGAEPRPFLVVADGRGSAEHSDIGAQCACDTISQTVRAAESLLTRVLDEENEDQARTLWCDVADLLFRSVLIRQAHAAETRALPTRQLEHTLLMAILGSRRIALMHIGDGAIVAERDDALETLSRPARGEFANVTCFVGTNTRPEQVRTQLLPAERITGIAAVSDGTAERMIHSRTAQPVHGFAQIFAKVQNHAFTSRDVRRFLTETAWEPEVQDDRSLALLSTPQVRKRNHICQGNTGADPHKADIQAQAKGDASSTNHTATAPSSEEDAPPPCNPADAVSPLSPPSGNRISPENLPLSKLRVRDPQLTREKEPEKPPASTGPNSSSTSAAILLSLCLLGTMTLLSASAATGYVIGIAQAPCPSWRNFSTRTTSIHRAPSSDLRPTLP